MNDLRYAVRTLLKTPGFTVVIILTLALGIGANTALFSVLNRSLLKPLPYADGDRLVQVQSTTKRSGDMSPAYPDFLDLQQGRQSFDAISGSFLSPANLVGERLTDRVRVAYVDSEFLRVFATTVAAGRGFSATDCTPSSAPTALITYETWQKRFGGSDGVVGRQINLAGHSIAIIGILPSSFRYHRPAEFLVPLAPFVREFFMDMRANHYGEFQVIGRLKPGVSLPAAQSELQAIAARLEKEYPKTNVGTGVELTNLRDRLGGGSRDTIYLLLGAVGMLLLIACVNVANMLLARACSREKEMALRVALGADRFTIVRQLLTESLLLACAGGLVGILVAQWFAAALDSLVPFSMRILGPDNAATADWRVMTFSVAVSLVTGIAFGLAPAWRLSGTAPQDALKVRTGSAPSALGGVRISDILVVAEVALAAMLLIGAGLLMRSLWRLQNQALGFEPERLVTLRIASPFNRLGGDWGRTATFYEQAADAVQLLPGVESVSVVNNLSYSGSNSSIMFYVPDRPVPPAGEFPQVLNKSVDPDYFRTMGIPLVAGRIFERNDRRPSIPAGNTDIAAVLKSYRDFVIDGVVTQSFAQKYWPGESAVGKTFRLGTPDMTFGTVQITGIVADSSQYFVGQRNLEEIYLSFRQWAPPIDFGLVIRAKGDPAGLVPSIRGKLKEFAPLEPTYDLQLQTQRIDGSIRDRRFNSLLFAAFASVALVLAMIGIYGVISFSVVQRTQEIGIRIALGAGRDQVLREVLRRGLRLFLPGIAVGLLAAWMLGRLIQNQLYDVTSTDPYTYAAAALALGAAALLACLVPARRATRVDPIEALRAE